MRSLRLLAREQYDEALKRERSLRKWTKQPAPPGGWSMEKEQQALLDNLEMSKPPTPSPRDRLPSRQHSSTLR